MYEYASGLIRVLEKEIMDQNDLVRMIDAPNSEAAFNVLNDSDLKDNIIGLKPEDFESAIKEDNIQLKNLLEPIVENKDLYDLLFLFEDFFNLKLLFKEKILGIKFNEKDYSELGLADVSDLKESVMKDEELIGAAENHLAESVKNIKELLKNEESESFIDSIIDTEYFECSVKISQKIKNKFILNFLYLIVDVSNARTVLRAKKIGLTREEARRQLSRAGNIETNLLLDYFNSEEKELINLIKNNPPNLFDSSAEYEKIWEEIFESYYVSHDIAALEKDLNIFKLKFIRDRAKQLDFGAEIILYYVYFKRVVNTNIKLILMGKINKIPAEEIKARLRL